MLSWPDGAAIAPAANRQATAVAVASNKYRFISILLFVIDIPARNRADLCGFFTAHASEPGKKAAFGMQIIQNLLRLDRQKAMEAITECATQRCECQALAYIGGGKLHHKRLLGRDGDRKSVA